MASIRYGVLGPLVVWRNDEPVRVSGRRQRVVLAMLLLNANRDVTIARLVDTVWPDQPPDTARAQVQTAVWRVRRALAVDAPDPVATSPAGYRLRVEPAALDLLQAEMLRQRARELIKAGRSDEATQVLGEALELWRGNPLSDIEWSDALRGARHRLAELHVATLEEWARLRLAAGHTADVAEALATAAGEHPLREGLTQLLMLAENRRGRREAALNAYERLRHALRDELGVEPGPGVRKLRAQIQGADPALAPPAASDASVAVTPRQLPNDIAGFTGRAEALAQLDKLASTERGSTSAAVISAVTGTAGVGKTALAIRWAHRSADRFPDGQLYVNLRGFDSTEPVRAGQALNGLLRSLGVPGQAIPTDSEGRALLYRSLLASRRMLILLDNANSADQVRPLLPGTPGCLVLVTSRNDLAGLIARDGARRVSLDRLPMGEALDLLRRLLGADRVEAELEAAVRLVKLCASLPLALRVMAERAVRRSTPLDRLADELEAARLDVLHAGGDPCATVRAVFSWSYRALDDELARLFRLLSLHPGLSFTAETAAALGDLPDRRAALLLEALASAHLLEESEPGRYRMHDLLREYAGELVVAHESEPDRRATVGRLLDFYLAAATTAGDRLEWRPGHPGSNEHGLTSFDSALAWLDDEYPNLMAAIEFAAEHGWAEPAWRLPKALWPYFYKGDHLDDWLATHQRALTFCRELGDRTDEAEILHSLGTAHGVAGRFADALPYYQRALALRRETGDRLGEARTLNNLALIHHHNGRYEHAVACFEHAMTAYRNLGDASRETSCMTNLADTLIRVGRCDEAVRLAHVALDFGLRHGNTERIIEARNILGLAYAQTGRPREAIEEVEQGLAAVTGAARLRRQEAFARTVLGRAYFSTGRNAEALDQYRQAMAVARRAGHRWMTGVAGHGLARVLFATGELDAAVTHARQALSVFTELGVPEAAEVRADFPDVVLPSDVE